MVVRSVAQSPPLELITVFVGSHSRVSLLEGLLAAEGIPHFVPDRTIAFVYPFFTGANSNELALQVPTPHVPAARALIDREFPAAPVAEDPARGSRWFWFALLPLVPVAIYLIVSAFTA